ncbi:MAG: radical SAM protein [Chloroflexi bacterium]|nr:radical SAM protein [Chloroflexota bacterium]
MKVLFVNPPTYEGKGTFNRPIRFPTFTYATPVMHPPLLLAYAASYVRSRGHEISFIDAEADSLTVAAFLEKAGAIKPDCAVFETSTPSFSNDVRVAEETRRATGCKTVFVGPHVSALPAESMRGNSLDAVILAEYELSLAGYLEKGGPGTPGVCYRGEDGEPVVNPPREYLQDLDILPFPARDLLPNDKYFDPILKNPFTFVLAGRGCPYRCTFCNWPQVLSGRRYRLRSPQKVVDELQHLEEKYGFRSFLFNDDTFTAVKSHAMAICDEMMRRGIKLPWGCYSRADNTDVELLKKLREAGCFILKVGVESGDQGILDNVHKNVRVEKVAEGVSLMKKMGFHVHGTFVFGLPGETPATITKTIGFARRVCPTTVQFSTAVPYPGAELHSYLKGKGYLKTEDWNEYMPMHPIFEYPELSAEQISGAVKRAYRGYYFRPTYFMVGLKQLFTEPRTVLSNVKKLAKMSV